jgi:hypothetical protein
MDATLSLRSLAKSLPGVRNLRHAPRYLTGSVTANRLGLQVMRVLGKHAIWRIRQRAVPAAVRSYVDLLSRDGVIAIPDFLTPEQFAAVREDFHLIERELEFRPVPFYAHMKQLDRGRIHAASHAVNEDKRLRAMRQYLVENPLLLAIVAAVTHVRVKTTANASIDVYQLADETAPDNDVETVMHADLHSTTVKAFYYLNDVDESNGAFVYAKGSSRLTLARLKHEYDISVRDARFKRGDTDLPPDSLAVRGPNKRSAVRPHHARAMGLTETAICAKANTLVIANNVGFHRRGDFTSKVPRHTVLLNFRHLQRSFWS